jgi:hypothetical protein
VTDIIQKLQQAAQHASGRMAATGFHIVLEVQPTGLFVRVRDGAGLEKVGALTWREVEAAHAGDATIITYVIDKLTKG